MFDLLSKIGEFLEAVWNFAKMIFEGLFSFFGYLADVTLHLPGFISWLPPVLIGGVTTMISIVIVYKVLNRTT